MKIKTELEKEIGRMMDIYEIYELSEESGLQDEFEKDIIKIYNNGRKESKKEFLELIKNKIRAKECGCGRNYNPNYPSNCGDLGTEKILLCEECQANIKVLKELKSAVEGKK